MELPWRFQVQKFGIRNSIYLFDFLPKKVKKGDGIPNFCPWNRHSNFMSRSLGPKYLYLSNTGMCCFLVQFVVPLLKYHFQFRKPIESVFFSKPISHVGAINASAIFTSAWFQAWYLQDHPHCIVKTLCTAESEVARLESPVAWVVSGYVQPTLLGQRAFISTYFKKSIYFMIYLSQN